MMAAARARRSPTSFMPASIARAPGLASGDKRRSPTSSLLPGRRGRKRLLDDQTEMLVAGFLLLGREQHLDQQPVGRGAVSDDQELGRRRARRVEPGLAL